MKKRKELNFYEISGFFMNFHDALALMNLINSLTGQYYRLLSIREILVQKGF